MKMADVIVLYKTNCLSFFVTQQKTLEDYCIFTFCILPIFSYYYSNFWHIWFDIKTVCLQNIVCAIDALMNTAFCQNFLSNFLCLTKMFFNFYNLQYRYSVGISR